MTLAEILSIISIVSFVLAGIFILLAVFFWFKFKIPKVVGDLSGRTAKKSINKIREQNTKTNTNIYKPVPSDIGVGLSMNNTSTTATKQTKNAYTANANSQNQETDLLVENNETDLLVDCNETELLVDCDETALLVQPKMQNPRIVMLDEVMLTDTNEVIR